MLNSKNSKPPITYINECKGIATLTIALILLVAITSTSLYSARIGIFDQRSSSNEYRSKEVVNAAEAGIEAELAAIKTDAVTQWVTGTSTGTLTNGASYAVTKTIAGNLLSLTSVGTTADGTGSATISEDIYLRPFISNTPNAPFIVGGTMGVTGSLEVIANSNGGGDGIPLSVWSSGATSFGGSSGTCHLEEYLESGGITAGSTDAHQPCAHNSCDCSTNPLSEAGSIGEDILDNDGAFPTDLFRYMFGTPTANWGVIHDISTVYNDCNSLSASSKGFI